MAVGSQALPPAEAREAREPEARWNAAQQDNSNRKIRDVLLIGKVVDCDERVELTRGEYK